MATFCTNLVTGEMTEYTNHDFLAFGRLGARWFGLRSNGIYELGGSTDNGTRIDCSATTHPNALGAADRNKTVHTAYLEAGSESIAVAPVCDDTPVGTFYGTDRVTLARGAKGRYWGFTFANVGGTEFRLQSVGILADINRRRV